MKIGGPKGPGPILPPSGKVSEPETTSGPQFKDVRQKDPAPLSGTGGTHVDEIRRQLEAGEINGTQATEMIINAIVRTKITAMKPELQKNLRDKLQQMIAEDPILAQKVKKLTEEE